MYQGSISPPYSPEMKESGRRKITLCICAGNRSHDLKLFKSFVSFLTLFHFVCVFFSPFLFSRYWWNKRMNGGRTLAFLNSLQVDMKLIHCDFCFLLTIKKQSKSASSNIKPNPNPDCWNLPVANCCPAAHCLGFYVLTVALKHIT